MNSQKYKEKMEAFLAKIRLDKDILAVLLFGSVARQEQTLLSDIDICLVMMPQNIPFDPRALSNKRLEYLDHTSFDIQIFQQLPLYIRRRVLKDGEILFVRDDTTLYELAFRTAQAYEDFKHIYVKYLEEVALAGP